MTVFVRIVLRIIAGFLAGKGFADATELANDAEFVGLVEMGLSGLLLAVSEGWYYLAKRFGWKT
jgi:hypothetical protein